MVSLPQRLCSAHPTQQTCRREPSQWPCWRHHHSCSHRRATKMAAVNLDAPSRGGAVLLKPIAIPLKQSSESSSGGSNERKDVDVDVDVDGGALAFEEFGKVVFSREDGGLFSPEADGGEDAQLELLNGTPRFYVMKLSPAQVKDGHISLRRITHHASVTQCLAACDSKRKWALVVVKAGVKPSIHNAKLFVFQGEMIVKLHSGTWHAGPIFLADDSGCGAEQRSASFFNLELADTNIVDHNNSDFEESLLIPANCLE